MEKIYMQRQFVSNCITKIFVLIFVYSFSIVVYGQELITKEISDELKQKLDSYLANYEQEKWENVYEFLYEPKDEKADFVIKMKRRNKKYDYKIRKINPKSSLVFITPKQTWGVNLCADIISKKENLSVSGFLYVFEIEDGWKFSTVSLYSARKGGFSYCNNNDDN